MAYAFEDKEKDEEQGFGEEQGKQLGAESAVISDSPKPAEQKEGGSGQYVNLQNYLNQNAPRQFGQEVAGKVGQRITEATSAQEQSGGQFRQAVEGGSTKMDKDLIDRAAENPEEVAGNSPELERFTAQRTAQYKGPENLNETEYWQPAQRATREAVEESEAGQSEGGIRSILDKYYGTGAQNYQYTAGQKNLDNLLIQMDPGARSAFQEQYGKGQEANQRFGQLEGELNQYAQGKKGETQEAARYAQEKVGGAEAAQRAAIEKSYQDAVANRNKAIADEQARVAKGQVSAAELGKNAGDSIRSFGVDPSQYLRFGAEPTINQTVSPEQRNKYLALATLMDSGKEFLPYGEQAGTYNPADDVYYEKDRMMNDIAARNSEYENLLNAQIFGMGLPVSNGEVSFGGSPHNTKFGTTEDAYKWASGISDPLVGGSLQDQLNEIKRVKDAWGDAGFGASNGRFAAIEDALNKLQEQKGYNKKLSFV